MEPIRHIQRRAENLIIARTLADTDSKYIRAEALLDKTALLLNTEQYLEAEHRAIARLEALGRA